MLPKVAFYISWITVQQSNHGLLTNLHFIQNLPQWCSQRAKPPLIYSSGISPAIAMFDDARGSIQKCFINIPFIIPRLSPLNPTLVVLNPWTPHGFAQVISALPSIASPSSWPWRRCALLRSPLHASQLGQSQVGKICDKLGFLHGEFTHSNGTPL